MPVSGLAEQRILVVEDSAVVAFDVAAVLVQLGARLAGPVASVGAAWPFLESALDGAVLDYRLGGETSRSIAQQLAVRGTPVLFITAHGVKAVASEVPSAPVLAKPFTQQDLEAALLRVFAKTDDAPAEPRPLACPAGRLSARRARRALRSRR